MTVARTYREQGTQLAIFLLRNAVLKEKGRLFVPVTVFEGIEKEMKNMTPEAAMNRSREEGFIDWNTEPTNEPIKLRRKRVEEAAEEPFRVKKDMSNVQLTDPLAVAAFNVLRSISHRDAHGLLGITPEAFKEADPKKLTAKKRWVDAVASDIDLDGPRLPFHLVRAKEKLEQTAGMRGEQGLPKLTVWRRFDEQQTVKSR